MASLETGKRETLPRSSSSARGSFHPISLRSRCSRFLLFKRLDYLQWISTVAVFLFFVALFQMFLPGSVTDKNIPLQRIQHADMELLSEIRELHFGETLKFHPWKLLSKFHKDADDGVSTSNLTKKRFAYRKPQLALVFPDLLVDPQQILMVTVAASLQEIGYSIQVFSLEEGPMRAVWGRIGVPLNIIQTGDSNEIAVDWLNYDGIILNYLEARGLFSSFMKEPFKSVPLIWTIHESTLAIRLRQYNSSGQVELLNDWKRIFARASVIVYPNYFLPMMYSILDSSNYFVIPGSPSEIWQANTFVSHPIKNIRSRMGYDDDDLVIVIVGSRFLYRGLWLEHALILQALHSILENSSDVISSDHLKLVFLSGDSNSNYSLALKTVAHNLGYPKGSVIHIPFDGDVNSFLAVSDLVIYGSFLEEQAFPDILVKAMSFEKPIVAPDLNIIKKHINDGVNGYLFPKDDVRLLTQIIIEACSKGKLSAQASQIALVGKQTARNVTVSGVVEGYASLVGNVVKLPSEAALPKADIPPRLKETWQWNLFEAYDQSSYVNRTLRSLDLIGKVEQQYNLSHSDEAPEGGTFIYSIWEGERKIQMATIRKKREDDELKDRTDQTRGTWEDVYRNAKKADRLKNDLHEREDGELERTGQPICIYEPFYGEGAWPFLHHKSLYRGIGLSTKGRRPGADDIDAPSRLQLLGNPYYRQALGEYGAFFAIANRVDRIHRNAWIGFQSWRATARKANLSDIAEKRLVHAIQNRKHGDALYFWVNMDMEPRNPQQRDFWSFCDAVNAGNCKFAFGEALEKVYGIKHHNFSSLPPMPLDGDTWSVMHSWALPTKSFLEFVMFSSGRRMIYVDPVSGAFQEQHRLRTRRGQMWVKWFSFATLKSLDEDLAEEYDTEHPKRRWLWPQTGEVFWQGIYEREKNQRQQEKDKRRQQSKDKISRMRRKNRQKVIGKYVKPPPEDDVSLNSSAVNSNTRR
uniref:Glycosyl transferase family 1 domain-containing protein n=1 Tax=Kalanchoe fedtschenkoi TaxID=63787 RepID=A0A7N0UMJ8_KALFE